MSTRIRYSKTSDQDVLQSVKSFSHQTNGARYKVTINQKELKYTIFETSSDTIVANGRAANLHQVKIKAKGLLQELGISFEAEARKVNESTETNIVVQ